MGSEALGQQVKERPKEDLVEKVTEVRQGVLSSLLEHVKGHRKRYTALLVVAALAVPTGIGIHSYLSNVSYCAAMMKGATPEQRDTLTTFDGKYLCKDM